MAARTAPNSAIAHFGKVLRLALLMTIALIFGAVPHISIAAPLEKITFGLAGAPTFGYAPLTFARELGFFADEGLDLDIVSLQGSGDIIPQLLLGTLATTMITPDLVILSRQPGKPNFPIRFSYNTYRRSIWQMVVLDQSPLRSIADLKGKTIGVGALAFANVVQSKALLKRNNIDPAEVSFVAVGVGVPAFEALRRGQIDVLNLFDSIHAVLAAQGTKIRELPYPPELRSSSSHGLAFTNKMIETRPDLVVKIGRAWSKGTIACDANPDACMAAHWKAYPTQKPAKLDDAMLASYRANLAAVIGGMLSFRPGETPQLGRYSDEDWTTTIASLRGGGELSGPDIALSSLYTNEFVDRFNAFDKDAVVAKAKAYR